MDQITEIVDAFREAVANFMILLSQVKRAKRLAKATRDYADALENDAVEVNGLPLSASDLTPVADYFNSLVTGEDEARLDLVKTATFIQVALDKGGIIPDDAVPTAEEALTQYRKVVTTDPKAGQGSQRLRAVS